MRATVVSAVALAIVAGCSGSKSPWARKMPKAEREAWPTQCGIPDAEIARSDGTADKPYRSISGVRYPEAPELLTLVNCSLNWDRGHDRIWYVAISLFAGVNGRISRDKVAPYLDLILRELRPFDAWAARLIASGPERTNVQVGALRVSGGFVEQDNSWRLSVWAD